MKKMILTLFLIFSFLVTYGNEVETEKSSLDFFNCYVNIQVTNTNLITGESYTYSYWQWVGYAGKESNCEKMAQDLVDSMNE